MARVEANLVPSEATKQKARVRDLYWMAHLDLWWFVLVQTVFLMHNLLGKGMFSKSTRSSNETPG
jgi:hypothetical protein